MSRKLKEAAVKIDINGLESDDLSLLARMMELAGQAEQSTSLGAPDLSQGVSALDINAPSTEVGMDTDFDNSMEDPLSTEPDLSQGVSMVGDFEPESDISSDPSVDISMEPAVESDSLGDVVGQDDFSNESDSMFDEDFDMDAMSSLAGLVKEDFSDDDVDSVDSDTDSEEEDSDSLEEARILPDLSINEDTGEEFGPFRSEQECEMNGQMETNGVSGTNFIVVPKPDGFYWKRTVQEDVVNRPEGHEYNTDGIENSRHDYRHKRTKLGDNTILTNIHESDEEDEEESVDQIHESLNEMYKKFIGSK